MFYISVSKVNRIQFQVIQYGQQLEFVKILTVQFHRLLV